MQAALIRSKVFKGINCTNPQVYIQYMTCAHFIHMWNIPLYHSWWIGCPSLPINYLHIFKVILGLLHFCLLSVLPHYSYCLSLFSVPVAYMSLLNNMEGLVSCCSQKCSCDFIVGFMILHLT